MNFLSKFNFYIITLISFISSPSLILAADSSGGPTSLDMITSPVGILCLLFFIIAYAFVMAEEFTHFRKSKPVILAATVYLGCNCLRCISRSFYRSKMG